MTIAAGVHQAFRRRRRAALLLPIHPAPADPPGDDAWLQIVSGARPRDVAVAAMELAARAAAAGARVVVVDAGRSLALHRAFGAEAWPGLVECLARPLPALGVVQQGGVPRVLLLAHGRSPQRPVWTHLDQLLEEVRPYCDRLVLALAKDAPREVGSILAGRLMDAWWACPRPGRTRAAVRLSDRIGIAFLPLILEPGDQGSLEFIRRRVSELTPPAVEPAAASPAAIADTRPSVKTEPPAVLDSDLQVRERLRFLAWMRRVQAEGRREELVSSKE